MSHLNAGPKLAPLAKDDSIDLLHSCLLFVSFLFVFLNNHLIHITLAHFYPRFFCLLHLYPHPSFFLIFN